MFEVVSLLSCHVTQQRARMLIAWIRVAIEMRATTLGNLYGFSYVMQALLCAQVDFQGSI